MMHEILLTQSLAQFGLHRLLLSKLTHEHQAGVNNGQRLGEGLDVTIPF